MISLQKSPVLVVFVTGHAEEAIPGRSERPASDTGPNSV